jgi:hypothetical protein
VRPVALVAAALDERRVVRFGSERRVELRSDHAAERAGRAGAVENRDLELVGDQGASLAVVGL